MAWRGSISRSIATTVRSVRTSPSSSSAFRHPSPPVSASRLPCRTPSFSTLSRPLSPLGGLQSLVTRQGVAIPQLTSHMPLAVTACRQLSQASCKVMTRQLTTVADKRNIGDYKRRLLAAKYELRRKLYKALCQDPTLPSDLRDKHRDKLSKLPRNSAFSRVRNRCIYSGRPRSVYRLFRTSRIVFRTLASEGSLMGVKKASW
ncbi:mitochondrial ribosomal protein S14 isoform X2 [Carex rostrata]